MLEMARQRYGIVPNYTTNGRGLSPEVLRATSNCCGAVAVSAYPPYIGVAEAVQALRNVGAVVNVHFMLNASTIDTAIDWLTAPPPFLQHANAIVFLNYKPVGRSPNYELLLNKSSRLQEFFELATSDQLPIRVGFDSCTITGLARFGNAQRISLEGCDAARFSLFVSERMEVYPCSLMIGTGAKGVSLRGTTLLDIWRGHPTFANFRAAHQQGGCVECVSRGECLSGCPLFPEINLCKSRALS
jgi:radical SAM protein with 4Fe4S-binding SPASM domain